MQDFLFKNKKVIEETTEHSEPWKLLIVDDEKDIHTITTLALSNFQFEDRSLEFLHAHSAKDAQAILQERSDIGLILLDVVMETDHAGLDLVKIIREDINNSAVRIVLRTGQPGQAPEKKIIGDYDINDYKSKTELTSNKLYTVVCASLRAYKSIQDLENHRKGLKKLIEASRRVSCKKGLGEFVNATFAELRELLSLNDVAMYTSETVAFEFNDAVLCTYMPDNHKEHSREIKLAELDEQKREIITRAIKEKSNQFLDNQVVLYCESDSNLMLFYLKAEKNIVEIDKNLLNLFTDNIKVILDNIKLNSLVHDSQREMIYRLGEAVESRSNETGMHVKRVAHYSELLARLYGVPKEQAEILKYASPLHDVGKISIPDAILNKPGKLDKEEWELMKTHAQRGYELLSGSNLLLMDMSAKIALTHHEKWDGTGYPSGLKGEEIDLFGRITALADVFDALGSDRCYKKAWPLEDIIELIKRESGSQFDPKLVSLLVDNLDDFLVIRDKYVDEFYY